MPRKPIDEALFAEMWSAGASCHNIGPAVGISRQRVTRRAAMMGLPPRLKAAVPDFPIKIRTKPKATKKPAPVPVYNGGLSAAIKRAGDSPTALGKVATSYRVPYREVMAMAGVRG